MKTLVVAWLSLLLTGIVFLFWQTEWVYNLPTPVPANYHNIAPGEKLDISTIVPAGEKPLFLHFFNPDCPCSKFNIEHFKSLVKTYGREVNFAIVPMSKEPKTAKAIQDMFDLSVPVILDTTLAARCGVYSTPQAVIADASQHLYYRGNYNKSRYCTNKKTEFAQIALDSLLHKKSLPGFDHYALKAYGCSLPTLKALAHE